MKMSKAKKQDQDWRIGLTCKPKYVCHPLYGFEGRFTVLDTHPSGFFGIESKGGVLTIGIEGETTTIIDGANNWVTAEQDR